MAIVLDGSSLTVEKMIQIARHNEKVELHPEALERIKACRAMLEKKIKAGETMYGINTGIGEFSEVILDDDQVKQFQKYLILVILGDSVFRWTKKFNLRNANLSYFKVSSVRSYQMYLRFNWLVQKSD